MDMTQPQILWQTAAVNWDQGRWIVNVQLRPAPDHVQAYQFAGYLRKLGADMQAEQLNAVLEHDTLSIESPQDRLPKPEKLHWILDTYLNAALADAGRVGETVQTFLPNWLEQFKTGNKQ